MTRQKKEHYFQAIRKRYRKAKQDDKSAILDEILSALRIVHHVFCKWATAQVAGDEHFTRAEIDIDDDGNADCFLPKQPVISGKIQQFPLMQ